jgi:cytochrome c553
MKKVLLAIASTTLAVGSFSVQASGASDYAAFGCGGCHGSTGKSSISVYPHLAGQNAAYTVKQLKDFQSGARKDPTMQAMAAMVVGKEQAIADYLAGL